MSVPGIWRLPLSILRVVTKKIQRVEFFTQGSPTTHRTTTMTLRTITTTITTTSITTTFLVSRSVRSTFIDHN